MTRSEEILLAGLDVNQINIIESEPHMKLCILGSMDMYAEEQCDVVQDLFSRPYAKLIPLEDLWRKENYPCGKYVIPDTTKFYEWIANKILNT